MIWEELSESLVMIGLDAKTNVEVIEALGGRLTEEGYGKDSYVQALKEREVEFPTGLDVDGVGVAIPHPSAEHVQKSAIAIATLAHPVAFEEMGMPEGNTVDVSLVFMLAVADPKAHLEELQRIIAIVQDRDVLMHIIESKDVQEVIETIKKKELSL